MVKQPQYEHTLFIITETFIDSLRDDSLPGSGTAVLRPFTVTHMPGLELAGGKVPRAASVPIGWSYQTEGFPFLEPLYIKRSIDFAIERISALLDLYPSIDQVIYSCDDKDPNLIGTGVFKDTIDHDVVNYISSQLKALPTRKRSKMSSEQIREREKRLLPFALSLDSNARKDQEITRLRHALDQHKVTGNQSLNATSRIRHPPLGDTTDLPNELQRRIR